MHANTTAGRIAPLAPKLAPMIGKLASDHEGEVLATVRAIGRLLDRNGLSFNDIGVALGGTACGPTPEFTREREVVLTDWRCAVQWIRTHPLWDPSDRERKFVIDMNLILKRHAPTERQAEWIIGIVERLGGAINV